MSTGSSTASAEAGSASGRAGSPLPPVRGSTASEVASAVATVSVGLSDALTGVLQVVQAAGVCPVVEGAGRAEAPGPGARAGQRRLRFPRLAGPAARLPVEPDRGRAPPPGRGGPAAPPVGAPSSGASAGPSAAVGFPGVLPDGGTSAIEPSPSTAEVGAAVAGRPGLGRTGLAPGLGASAFGSICGLSAAALASAAGEPGGGI